MLKSNKPRLVKVPTTGNLLNEIFLFILYVAAFWFCFGIPECALRAYS